MREILHIVDISSTSYRPRLVNTVTEQPHGKKKTFSPLLFPLSAAKKTINLVRLTPAHQVLNATAI